MQLSAVALVLFKGILRVFIRVFQHQPIPADLRQYRRGGDGHRLRVAPYDEFSGDIQRRQAVAVDHRVIRLDGKPLDGAAHSIHGRLKDIIALDLLDRAEGDRAGNSRLDNDVEQSLTLLLRQLFRVVHTLDDTSLGQDNSGGADGSRQGSASRFIDAADMAIAFFAGFVFIS